MNRVLVTGAGGFLGRELVALLARSGHLGVGTGRQPPKGMPAGWVVASRADMLEGRRKVDKIDAVVHLEVKHHVTRTDAQTIMKLTAANVGGTRDWLGWASNQNVNRFVFASSVKAVQAGPGETLETAEPETSAVYGCSKARAEKAVCDWVAADANNRATILRFAPVYGPGNTANLAAFARQVLLGRPCFVGKGRTKKSVVSLRNATSAIEWALHSSLPGCEVFNVSDRTSHSIGELANIIATMANAPRPRGMPVALARVGAVVGDVAEMILARPIVLNSKRLQAMLQTTVFPPDKLMSHGFVHVQETTEGIAELVAWLKGQLQANDDGSSRRATL